MVISQTPLRISFVGGGSDLKEFYQFSEGKVISCTINKFIYIILKKRFDEKIYIDYSDREIVDEVDDIKHELVRECLKKVEISNSLEITSLADIPSEGSGLGSSSTFTVGLLHALYIYKGIIPTKEKLAREACEIEIEILKKPIGKQDQYAAAYGNVNEIIFKKNGSVKGNRLNISDCEIRKFGSNILLYFTNKTRKSSKILKEQKKKTKDKLSTLNKMVDLVEPLKKNIINNNWDELGRLLHQNWIYKKTLASKIANSDINNMYQKALDAGAIGGKISGAGGGGFMLLYVPREKQDNVREAMKEYRELPFMIDKYGSRIIFDHRT